MSETDKQVPRILVIDDNQAIHADFRKILCPERGKKLDDIERNLFGAARETAQPPTFEMDSAYQGEEGLARVQAAVRDGRPYCVAFVDVRMPPGWDGIETVARLWEAAPELQVVLCTAYSDYSWSQMTSRLKYSDRLVVLKKPFDTVEVLQLAAAMAAKWRLLQRTARTLSETEERYDLLFHKNPLPMWVIDLKTQAFLSVNEAASRKYGYSREEFALMTVRDLHPPEDAEFLSERFSEDSCRVPANRLVVKHRKKDGSLIFAEIISHVVTFSGCEAKFALANDVTESRQAEDRIREQAALLDLAGDAILVRDISGHVRFWNKAAERLYGCSAEKAIGVPLVDLLKQDTQVLTAAEAQLLAYGEWSGEMRKRTRDGQEVIVNSRWTLLRDEQNQPHSILIIDSDITEKKKLEAQFLRAQRIESIGTLATGMAHDLNNILAPILMSAGFLRWNLREEEREKAIGRIELSVKRGAEIIQQVLTFGRGIDGERVAVNPATIVDEIGRIIGQTFPKNINVEVEIQSGLWAIIGDPTQVHQVLLNLSVNARDAMLQGGKLSLRASNVILKEPMPALPTPAPAGRYVVFEVTDTGCGIAPADRERIFDPFYTTKEVGKGTGLGLSTALGIVKSHRGVVIVDSEPGKGTTFRVFLPASASAAHKSTAKISRLQPAGRGESILLVDDEPDVMAGMVALLERNNYRPLAARNGEEALALLAHHHGVIDAVITDIMMPTMDGVTFIRNLQEVKPGLRIIATSGQGTDMNGSLRSQELRLLGVSSFLAKPYASDKLLAALHDLLSGANGTPMLRLVV
ncbi:MAG TPA: PAS domain S-box protein [Verrucomicrobiae bacterium]|nr:PAS domain S-box protein [Verrucomicrobiae bacterium]